MAFDWHAFLRRYNIEFVTTGPNASRGRLNVHCPFCGHDDPSQHLGISLKGHGWNCWRNTAHRGRSAPRLVQALIHCSREEAERLVHGDTPALPQDADLMSRKLMGAEESSSYKRVQSLSMPKEFKPLTNKSPFAKPFQDYLCDRGYRPAHMDWLCQAYDLHYTTRGKFSYRVIIPVCDRYDRLLTWTGRSIRPGEEMRYRSLEREQSLCIVKDTLFALPLLWRCNNPNVLLVCEGPFDAMWITNYGRSFGVYATCLFGLSLSNPQMELLADLRERFSYVGLLLDSAASFQSFKLATNGFNLDLVRLPHGVKDPAELTPNAVTDLCLSVL